MFTHDPFWNLVNQIKESSVKHMKILTFGTSLNKLKRPNQGWAWPSNQATKSDISYLCFTLHRTSCVSQGQSWSLIIKCVMNHLDFTPKFSKSWFSKSHLRFNFKSHFLFKRSKNLKWDSKWNFRKPTLKPTLKCNFYKKILVNLSHTINLQRPVDFAFW